MNELNVIPSGSVSDLDTLIFRGVIATNIRGLKDYDYSTFLMILQLGLISIIE